MRKASLLAIFIILAFGPYIIMAQGDEAQVQPEPTEEAAADAGTPEMNEQRFASMRRTACLVLSRYHSNTQKETIEGIVQSLSPENQQKYINKIYASAVQQCETTITQSEVQELFVENKDFDPTHLFHHFDTVDYAGLASAIDSFSPNEEDIVKFMKNFDEQMAVRREEQQAEKEKLGGEDRYEMKFFGLSFKDIPSTAKMIYLLIFVGIIGGALFYGFSQLDKDKKKKSTNKRRKSPKKE